jgi:hypothetical protein
VRQLVRGEAELQAFRRSWTGERLLELLRESGGRLRINWPIGVGKSHSIDAVIEAAVRGGDYDLVIALFPTRQLVRERRWIQNPPADVLIANLQPRPRQRCGRDLDESWRHFERAGLGVLGRERLCKQCPKRCGCPWPKQYGKQLRGSRVIYGTQALLECAPTFLGHLKRWARADRVLVLLDEVNLLMTSYRQTIASADLARFVHALEQTPGAGLGAHRDWIYRADLLLKAPTEDLRDGGWRMPFIAPPWALAIQERGWELYGQAFKFLAYDLQEFGRSSLDSRERDAAGNLHFAARPYVGWDFIIYSGTAHPELAAFRLGQDFASPFDGYRFEHPGTSWYNIASRLGVRRYFPANADQVLDFFAEPVARRLREGRRPLLIAKKCFLSLCRDGMSARLHELGLTEARVITTGLTPEALARPHVVPLISYGTIGTNLFEGFDAAYCLTGYYVNEVVVNSILQDVLASDGHIAIKITTGGRPRRRTASVVHADHRVYDVHRLAQLALSQQEMDVVLQAVGRVRPYTRPREVITFQCSEHPHMAYTAEFSSVGEARQFFRIPDRRGRQRLQHQHEIKAARERGLTQQEAAEQIGVSLSTIKRYWK